MNNNQSKQDLALERIKQTIIDDSNYQTIPLKLGAIWYIVNNCGLNFELSENNVLVTKEE